MELPINILQSTIQRGTILHSTIFKSVGHGKFFIVLGITDEHIAGFFYVNSKIHPSIERHPEQFAMQYQMKHADYSFLEYDSFVCATKIQRISSIELAESMQKHETTLVGKMRSEHLEELLEACRNSRLFSKIEKITFFE